MGVRVNPLELPLPNLHCHAHWARSHFDTLIIILQLVHPAYTLTLCTCLSPSLSTPFTQMAFLLVQVLCSCCFLMKVCYSSGSAVTGRMKWPATYLGPMHAVIPPALWSPFLSTCGAGYMLGKTKKKKMSRRSPLVSSPIYLPSLNVACSTESAFRITSDKLARGGRDLETSTGLVTSTTSSGSTRLVAASPCISLSRCSQWKCSNLCPSTTVPSSCIMTCMSQETKWLPRIHAAII